MSGQLVEVLQSKSGSFAPVTAFDLNQNNPLIFDLTNNNADLVALDLNNEKVFSDYIFNQMKAHDTKVGIGIYNEDRYIYKRSEVFGGAKVRSIHLGIDIWAEAATPVYAPLDGKVHSFKNNNAHGDYGPTLILQHELEGVVFYTLYGHLSLSSIASKQMGQKIESGEKIAELGDYSINVHWPSHLHFQVISDMQDYFGDFPGVAAPADRKQFLELCPDPNLILGVEALK